jgi:hypothetical protein
MFSRWTKNKFFYFFCASASCAAACTPSFASASDVSDLRVLAVQAEPPEAQFDQQGSGSNLVISNVDDVHLRILAVDPARPGNFMTLSASLCAPTDSRRCEGGPRFDLPRATRNSGDEFSATVPGALLVPVIRFAQSDDKLKGLGGIRVMFALSVADADPHAPVYASKLLLYSQRGTPPNHNPTLSKLTLTRDGVFQKDVFPGETLALSLGALYGVRPVLADGAREEYDTTDLQGRTVHLKEDPSYAFFTTPGAEFDRDTADEPIDGIAPPDGLTRIDSFSRGSDAINKIWVVVRDGRGGESWLSFPWTVP